MHSIKLATKTQNCKLRIRLSYNIVEIFDGFGKTFAQLDGGFPVQDGLSLVNDGLALLWVVLCGGLIDDFGLGTGKFDDQFCQLLNRKLVGVS